LSAELSLAGALTAAGAGAISFLSPCVLPLVPGYVSFIAGRSLADGGDRPRRALMLALSLCFVLGFSTVFVALGAAASALGALLLSYRYEANLIGGALVIVFGAFLSGLIRFPALERDLRCRGALAGGRPETAYLLGVAFAFGWTPCIGPVLGSILAVTTMSTSSGGMALLAAYSAGLGVPFVLAALATARLSERLRRLRRAGVLLQRASGLMMIVMGVAMVTGRLTDFAIWLLDLFPVLGRFG